jgi:hypothetical protein
VANRKIRASLEKPLEHLGDSTGLKELPPSGFLVDPARLNVGTYGMGLLLRYYEE